MKYIRLILLVIILAAVIYWLWTGNDEFLPYVMLTAALAMLLNTYEAFAKSWKSLDGYLFLTAFAAFGAYGVALLLS